MDNATMLYRPSDEPNEGVWGLKVETTIVDAGEVDYMLAGGWFEHPTADDESRRTPGVLDQSAKDIEAQIPSLSDEDLLKALDDEMAGKTRKGVVAMIEEEIKSRSA